MESVASKASKDNNNNFLLLLIVPIYAVIVAVAIDFLLYRKAIRKKVKSASFSKYYLDER